MDYIHFLVIIASVSGPNGTVHDELRSAQARGFTAEECAAAISTRPMGSRTPNGDLVLIAGCVEARTPLPATKPMPPASPAERTI